MKSITYRQAKMRNKRVVLYNDNEPRAFIGNAAEIAAIEKAAVKHSLSSLIDLVNHKCILSNHYDQLQKDINTAFMYEDFLHFRTMLHNIETFLEHSEDWECLYLRVCEIDLRSFIEKVIGKYQDEIKQRNGKVERIRSIIENNLSPGSHNVVCASLSDHDTPADIAEILYYEVVEYYGGDCWDHAEMAINDLSPYHREQIGFKDLVEIIHGCCIDFG